MVPAPNFIRNKVEGHRHKHHLGSKSLKTAFNFCTLKKAAMSFFEFFGGCLVGPTRGEGGSWLASARQLQKSLDCLLSQQRQQEWEHLASCSTTPTSPPSFPSYRHPHTAKKWLKSVWNVPNCQSAKNVLKPCIHISKHRHPYGATYISHKQQWWSSTQWNPNLSNLYTFRPILFYQTCTAQYISTASHKDLGEFS